MMMLLVSLSLLVLSASAVPLDRFLGHSEPPKFDLLKLTQSWLPGVCIYVENEHHTCGKSEASVTPWVIHGLWPTEHGSYGPNYCNDTWKFDVSKVQVLRPRLDNNWPSIQLDQKPEESWKHEWEKHGTCGASLPELKDEVHYFNQTMALHNQFNMSLILMKAGIVPSADKTYTGEAIQSAISKALSVTPSVVCVKDQKSGKFFLEQVELCLDTSFKPISCASSGLTRSAQDLLFKPEVSLLRNTQQDISRLRNIVDCGSGDVYYKPMPKPSEN